jgi:hypothetical protein
LRNVDRNFLDRRRRFQSIQLGLRAIDHGDRIVAATAQKLRNHRADFARAYDNDVFHAASKVAAHFYLRALQMVGLF